MKAMLLMLAYAFLVLSLANKCNALTKACLGDGNAIPLQPDIYLASCPEAEDIIFSGVGRAIAGDPRMAASLLRLHFHDCFVNGCDASVLLDDTPTFIGEKTAPPNVNSLRGFEVIDSIKSELEFACPQTVSCADILAIAARDSVTLSGGPTWKVEMGRRDSLTANPNLTTNIPSPTSNVATLVQKFQNVGLSQKDMVALSGGHTIGRARCTTFASRFSGVGNAGVVPPGTDMEFQQSLQQLCMGSNSTLTHLDVASPVTFDNQYFINLLSGQGLLPSDQALVAQPGEVSSLVEAYAMDPLVFFDDFTAGMLSMGRLAPPAGTAGEVRRNCRSVN